MKKKSVCVEDLERMAQEQEASASKAKEDFEEWAILELMGHRKLSGLVKEETIGSASFIRIDIPGPDGKFISTQFYNPSALYCMTPVTKETALQVARNYAPRPVERWEMRALTEPAEEDMYEEDA